ncbi:SRPBCC family protein [Amycolatopsis sp. A133]|uniref:SRPBCC family protein n=1 Tax=Amycolatopsis sp. A133 TaxID=3064472 RepID=UPI0027FC4AFC|nr:SRPBCC family protein [Amycolatopsis sp. A133]MDQ7808626.1 SRPBCC family protein [Amycolatopsis sp. A133]
MTRTFTVAAAPHEALDYLKDLRHAADWHPGTLSCGRLGTGPVEVGARWHNVAKIAGVELELTCELVRLEPGRVVFTGTNDTTATRDDITITPTGAGGSTLTYHATIEFRGAADLGAPIAEVVFEKAGADAEDALTRILGTPAWASGGPF